MKFLCDRHSVAAFASEWGWCDPQWSSVRHEIHARHFGALALQSGVPDAFDRMVRLVLQVPPGSTRDPDLSPPASLIGCAWIPARGPG
jgi:hypothetical protein